MRPLWLVKGFGRMPISGEYTQRMQEVQRAFTRAGAIRKVRRLSYVRVMNIPTWRATRIR